MIKKIDLHAYATAFPQYIIPHIDGSRFMSAQELLAQQEKLNIDFSVLQTILSPEGQRAKLGSENCKHIASQFPAQLGWFCGMDPRMGCFRDDTDFTPLFDFFIAAGAKGVGEIAPSLYVDDAMTENLLSWCAKYRMPALVRYTYYYGAGSGTFDDRGFPRTERILEKYPQLRLIACGEGFWAEYGDSLFRLMEKHPNLCCVISGKDAADALMQDAETATAFLERFADQIYYGTGMKSAADTYPYKLDHFLTELAESGKLNISAYEKIVRKNAQLLLGNNT